MVLKGGTAFAKFYNSDRFSEDLDFTLSEKVEKQEEFAKSTIRDAIERLEYTHSYKEEPHVNDFGIVASIILVEGPKFNGKASTAQQIRFEVATAKKLYLGSEAMPRNPAYADARPYVALVMKREEILAEKIRALMSLKRRHRERDLYDLYFFMGKDTRIDKDLIHKKLSEAGIKPSIEGFGKAIKSIERAWKSLEPMVQHKLEDFLYVSDFVEKRIHESSVF